jgi:hypothetical protein
MLPLFVAAQLFQPLAGAVGRLLRCDQYFEGHRLFSTVVAGHNGAREADERGCTLAC